MTKHNIFIIAPNLIPTLKIGFIQPLLELKNNGEIYLTVIMSRQIEKNIDQILEADLVIFCRNCEGDDLQILELLLDNSVPYIYGIDDNFFSISTETPIGMYHRHPVRVWGVRHFIKHASLVKVYSGIMFDVCKQYSSKVEFNKFYFDLDLISKTKVIKDTNKIRIAYATSRSEDKLCTEVVQSALFRILEKYKDKVEIVLFGNVKFNRLRKYAKNIKTIKFKKDYIGFIESFSSCGANIALAPLGGSVFENSKTNNKYREYSACKMAGIYSDQQVYSCVTNNENGLLVENTIDAWFEAMSMLIDNEQLRTTIIESAFQDIKDNYSKEAFLINWRKSLNIAIAAGSMERPIVKNTYSNSLYLSACSDGVVSKRIVDNILSICSAVFVPFDGLYGSHLKTNILILCFDQRKLSDLIVLLRSEQYQHIMICTFQSLYNRHKNVFEIIEEYGCPIICLGDDSEQLEVLEKTSEYESKNELKGDAIEKIDLTISKEILSFDNSFVNSNIFNLHLGIEKNNFYIELYDLLYREGYVAYNKFLNYEKENWRITKLIRRALDDISMYFYLRKINKNTSKRISKTEN